MTCFAYDQLCYSELGDYIDSEIEGTTRANIKFEKFYSTFSVAGREFTHVKAFVPDDSRNGLSQRSTFYWAGGVGLVRSELSDGTIWNLQRYHISN